MQNGTMDRKQLLIRFQTILAQFRDDALPLINGMPVTQIKLKTLDVNPRRVIEQIVEYKNDPGNAYSQLFQTGGYDDANR